MNKIAAVLISYGMDFQYENDWEGEKIISFELALEVVRQDGKIYYENMGEKEEYKDTDSVLKCIAGLVDQACIDETASF